MDDLIIISNLNDFIFCPASIYFHKLYGSEDKIMYQSKAQLDGTRAHEKIDNGTYSTRKKILISNDIRPGKIGKNGYKYYLVKNIISMLNFFNYMT